MSPASAVDDATGKRRRRFSPLGFVVTLLLVAAMAVGGWMIWLFWGTVQQSRADANAAITELRQRWDTAPAPDPDTEVPRLVPHPEPGTAQWLIKVPRLGGREWPVFVGAEHTADGVAWYPGTAQPGQLGNFGVAGLQITHAEPFRGFLDLVVGDKVIVESSDAVFTYTISSAPRDLTVQAGDSWVLDPVPGKSEVEPWQAMITLTTSEDLIPTDDRAVAFGVLESMELK